jgi:integrase
MANYGGHIRDLWRPRLGHLRPRDLRRHHIEAALRELSKPVTGERRTGRVGRRVTRRSGTTVDGYRRTLRTALSAAERRGLITINPAQGRIDAIPARAKRRLSIWEPEETAHYLEHVAGDRLAALHELAAYAGLRRAELCGMRWCDLDDDWGGLTVRQTLVEVASKDVLPADQACPICGVEHKGWVIKEPKSLASERWVPLVSPARAALVAYREAQLAQRAQFGADYADHDLVFCAPDGTPLRPGTGASQFKAHARTCDLPAIALHDTRHGACSLLLSGGVPIEVVQMILGHSTPAIKKAIAQLRNAELKDQEITTGLNAHIQVDTVRAVFKDGELHNLPPNPASQLPRGRMYWTFTTGDFAGQEVLPTLRNYYNYLASNILPRAERLLP